MIKIEDTYLGMPKLILYPAEAKWFQKELELSDKEFDEQFVISQKISIKRPKQLKKQIKSRKYFKSLINNNNDKSS